MVFRQLAEAITCPPKCRARNVGGVSPWLVHNMIMRVWFNGRTALFQGANGGSIPLTRSSVAANSTNSPRQQVGGSYRFVAAPFQIMGGLMLALQA